MASRGTEHDGLVLAVGAVVLVGVLLMGAWVAHAEAISSSTPPHVKVAWSGSGSGPDGGSSPAASPSTSAPAQASASNDGGLSQTLAVPVLPGSLTISPTADSVTFSPQGNGQGGAYLGTLPLVRVVDARGSLVGWDASVSLQGVDELSASQLASAQLCVNPDAPTTVAGNPGEVRAATQSCGGVGGPVSVFFAPASGGGGTFTDTAALTLRIPAGGAPNPMTATLAITIH